MSISIKIIKMKARHPEKVNNPINPIKKKTKLDKN